MFTKLIKFFGRLWTGQPKFAATPICDLPVQSKYGNVLKGKSYGGHDERGGQISEDFNSLPLEKAEKRWSTGAVTDSEFRAYKDYHKSEHRHADVCKRKATKVDASVVVKIAVPQEGTV